MPVLVNVITSTSPKIYFQILKSQNFQSLILKNKSCSGNVLVQDSNLYNIQSFTINLDNWPQHLFSSLHSMVKVSGLWYVQCTALLASLARSALDGCKSDNKLILLNFLLAYFFTTLFSFFLGLEYRSTIS